MLELRPYQRTAIDRLYAYFEQADGHPLVSIPTGGGKSLVIADFVKGALTNYPETRVLIVTHVRELIEQNAAELRRLWPVAPIGIYSAGLGRRDLGRQITFASVQSVFKKADRFGHIDLLLVDEAHLIPTSGDTMYRKLIADLETVNHHLRVIGFTATPYRLDSGLLTMGPRRVFTDLVYDCDMRDLIRDGYLSRLSPVKIETRLDVSGVARRGGEYVAAELAAAVDQDGITRSAVAEIIKAGADRKSWLIFCTSVDHAFHARDILREFGIDAETVTGQTPADERDGIVKRFKAGQVRALTNVNVLTTGFNAPAVDLLAMLRPTLSAGLYVQMLGRGTRNAPGKTDCLVLDFADNIKRHGPIFDPDVQATGEKKKALTKTCPNCEATVKIAARECPDCGWVFPVNPRAIKIADRPDGADPMAVRLVNVSADMDWLSVHSVRYRKHIKPGSPTSLRVDYRCGVTTHSEWVCLEHFGYARQKAVVWWSKRTPGPIPETIEEALARSEELKRPVRICVRQEGKFTRIVAADFEPLPDLQARSARVSVSTDQGLFDALS